MLYYIEETNGIYGKRESYTLKTTNLRSAKRTASKNAFYLNTVLKIYDETKNLLSMRLNKRWENNNA